MSSRYIAAKLFFVLSALCALVGIILFRRGAIGSGLRWEDYANPLFFVTIPRLIPFAASILSACFGLVYFGIERRFKRPANIFLVLVHMTSFLLAILGHATLVGFWWRVLGDEHANIPLPLWANTSSYCGSRLWFEVMNTTISVEPIRNVERCSRSAT